MLEWSNSTTLVVDQLCLGLALVLITIWSTLLAHSGCARASMPRCVGKELADRAVAGLCVYWCSIERASVREFLCTPKFRCFIVCSMQFCSVDSIRSVQYCGVATAHDHDLLRVACACEYLYMRDNAYKFWPYSFKLIGPYLE